MEGTDNTTRNGIKTSKGLFVFILLLYIMASVVVTFVARSQIIVTIGSDKIPLSLLTGVFSSLSNICLIFLVVFFNKTGFILALSLIVLQFPLIAQGIIVRRNFSNIPGFFSSLFSIIAIIVIYRRNKQLVKYKEKELTNLKEQQRLSQNLFEQTARALVNAIDAKDTYSHGHSIRVAEYSRKIAKLSGKSEDECYRIYYTALLHDVGKIGIDESIINKKGKLTDDEYEIIKKHPYMGSQILKSINEYPYLSIGAHYHHERYDGRGYPYGLKGENIPEIARIISVADAYDAMTSNRSYRDSIPQDIVREEIVKGSGTQFDPVFAKIMMQLIDQDSEYDMKEKYSVKELAGANELVCGERRSRISDGIVLTDHITSIHLKCTPEEGYEGKSSGPSMILFDALDGRFHRNEKTIKELLYYEYCEIWFDGRYENKGVRKIETKEAAEKGYNNSRYGIEAVKCRDHVLIKIRSGLKTTEVIIALPDSSRYVYIGLTGEHCILGDVRIDTADTPVAEGHIPRIASEISYIDGKVGDIPNVQVDGQRTAATDGIPVKDGLTISFHSMSLPTARLVWHCPFIVLFSSDDEKVNGKNYREYALIRFDGEDCEDNSFAGNRLIVNVNDDFEGWDAWKKANQNGIDCKVSFSRKGNKITLTTENLGLSVRNTTTINDGREHILAALTGDQCALTDIHVGF